ncbi:MAG: hypothetical protein NZM43_12530 [Saprospiraceae bacterium]|nr:hypothetical protein [Saprospiraceae bacterium]MDW8485138.1 hypothetical protein [Saprospiraceae bacterium]
MKAYINEGIGALILTILALGGPIWAANKNVMLAYGAALTSLMLACPFSMGFNPAIMIAQFLAGNREKISRFWPYQVAAQFLGAFIGSLLATFAIRCSSSTTLPPAALDDLFCSSFSVALGTLSLGFVYLNLKDQPSTQAAATGLITFAASSITNINLLGSFNPAVYLGLVITGALSWGGFAAATLAVVLGMAGGASLILLTREQTLPQRPL